MARVIVADGNHCVAVVTIHRARNVEHTVAFKGVKLRVRPDVENRWNAARQLRLDAFHEARVEIAPALDPVFTGALQLRRGG